MKKTKIIFNFEEKDGSSYQVSVNGTNYTVNSDNNELEIEQSPDTEFKISFRQGGITVFKGILLFFICLVKIPVFLIFESLPENRWYKQIPLHNFDYSCVIGKYSDKINISVQNLYKGNVYVPCVEINGDCETGKIYQNSVLCFKQLKRALLEYCFTLFWAEVVLYIILLLCFKENLIAVSVISVLFLALYIALVFLAVKKYKKIRSEFDNSCK